MIVIWNNNIVDYKCKGFFFFFLMLVYVLKKKRREHATYDIRDSYYKPVAPALCWCNPPGPHHHTERVSNPGFRCGRQAHLQGTPKATASSVNRFTHHLYWYTHLLHWHPTVGINAPPENLLFCCFLWFSLSSLRFLLPGVGLTGSSRPSKVLLEFKALILKTEHKQTLQSVVMLDCMERILIDREDISHLG